jgi:hypothetical protein
MAEQWLYPVSDFYGGTQTLNEFMMQFVSNIEHELPAEMRAFLWFQPGCGLTMSNLDGVSYLSMSGYFAKYPELGPVPPVVAYVRYDPRPFFDAKLLLSESVENRPWGKWLPYCCSTNRMYKNLKVDAVLSLSDDENGD